MVRQQSIVIRKMMKTYGQTVSLKRRTKTVDSDGDFTYSYEDMEPITGQFTQLTAMDQSVEHWGFHIEADYIGTFLPGTVILEGDLLYIDNGWREVQNKVDRMTKGTVDYIEALLRTKEI